ncbi:MAG: glycosyltransferase family 2 protein [Opitutales bacterium]|uniref:glycosyltransferase family 2 protein n=1 Tax=Gilvibacter sp. TaxID=2729997 RepID=UPI0025B81BFB|nr:glycosyltransferase family 2 protein [Gilvibacter sp.]MCH2156779.1 glycosyltransferase family 2 protein [Opitutales bacterium]NQX78922.1 glycosyltransferase family 2 protein [Gilvibacter sp.]NRA27199.1 glycosyltransferase family 2 protein [Opitutales bacterium]
MSHRKLSFIIPVYNEEATVIELYERIEAVVSELDGWEHGYYFVDDGSGDDSWKAICDLKIENPTRVHGLRLRRNFGKAEALQLGFDEADADVVITMDSDLQDDPQEIPNFLSKLDQGYDLVSGWKQVRHDPIDKTLPSRVFNALARVGSGVQLHDFNCGFKAYRGIVVKRVKLFGELHRFIPILADAEGFRIGELPVNHLPRLHGVSKYGSKRFVKGLLDLITVIVLTRYLRRPAHIFGGAGLLFGSIGFLILFYLSFMKIFFGEGIGGRPLFFLGILLLLLGAQLVSLGLVAEIINRQSKQDPSNHISETV